MVGRLQKQCTGLLPIAERDRRASADVPLSDHASLLAGRTSTIAIACGRLIRSRILSNARKTNFGSPPTRCISNEMSLAINSIGAPPALLLHQLI